MIFRVLLHPKAADFLKNVPIQLRNRITAKMRELQDFPERGKPLRYTDFRSLRIGKYRAIYEIDTDRKKVIILFIGHRKDVYSNFSKLF
jgi:mRNA interferase RelE/StbE